MRVFSFLSVLLVLGGLAVEASAGNLRAVTCPDSFLITPCICTVNGDQLDMTCSGLTSLKMLTDIFARTFPTNTFYSISISGSQLGSLPNDVFNGKSFDIINFLNNRYTSFENTRIFSSSQSRLTSLTVRQDTDNWTFDFNNVLGYNLLSELELSGYDMVLAGTLSSSSLVSVTLRSDLMVTVPSLGSLPILSSLNLDGASIASLGESSFSTLNSLSELYLGHNKLESLATGTLYLTGPVTLVDLSSNLIDIIQPGWITGLSPAASVGLVNNNINVLDPASFEGVIQSLIPSGKLLLDGNPLTCGCEVAWVVTDASYLTVVSDGRCVNGTRLTTLDPNYYLQNCF